MFFSACIGGAEDCAIWKRSFISYASRQTLEAVTFRQAMRHGYQVSWGWIYTKDHSVATKGIESTSRARKQTGKKSRIAFHTMAVSGVDGDALASNHAGIDIMPPKGIFSIQVPPCSPEHIVYASCASQDESIRGNTAYWISNDTRFLRTFHGVEVNAAAVYALLQYGAIPPPYTIDTGLTRVPGGYTWTAKIRDASIHSSLSASFSPDRTAVEIKRKDAQQYVNTTLDQQLTAVPEGSALFFSGGVDSSLLAWRLAQQGRTDVTLLNYTFGADDDEANLARRVANRLGLSLVQIEDESDQWGDVLGRIGTDYSHPFGDYSLLPTNMLAHAAARQLGPGRIIVDGTGADGAFGISEKLSLWKWLYRIPEPLRQMPAALYKTFGLWATRHRAEYVLRVVRRSTTMPMHQAAVIAQNPMDGIAYQIPEKVRTDLSTQINDYIQQRTEGLAETEQFSFLDLSFVCAGIFAAKSFDPLRAKGVAPVYPFLDPAMINTSLSLPWSSKSWDGEPKALLKRELEKTLPARWIYRNKSGFVPPIRQALGDANVQAILEDRVLVSNNPIIDFVERDVVTQMVKRVRNGQALADQTYNFLWSFCMVSLWLDDQ